MIGIYFPASAITAEQHNAVDEKVSGGVPPEGMKLHSAFQEGDKLAMFDVWESKEAFEAFGAKLMPVVKEMGLELPEPIFVEMVAFEVA